MLKFNIVKDGIGWAIFVADESDVPAWKSTRSFPTKEMAIQDLLMLHTQLQVLLASSIRSPNQNLKKKEKG